MNNDKQYAVQKIRADYVEKQYTDLDELKKLDASVKRPARVFAYVFGSIGALVMGSGMSLVMTEIGKTVGIENNMLVGIVTGIVGMALVLVNYPIYKAILKHRKKKHGARIIELSDKLMER